jgi:hypothetical protein
VKRFAVVGFCLALLLLSRTRVTGAVESFGAASLCGGHRFEPSRTLPLVRGTSFDLVVTGFGVDNADRVEAISLPGVSVRLAGRRAFPVAQLTLALKIDAKAPVGKGELRLRYPVEVAGYDRILVEVLVPASAPCQTPTPSPPAPRR